jgi:hypothetical protein
VPRLTYLFCTQSFQFAFVPLGRRQFDCVKAAVRRAFVTYKPLTSFPLLLLSPLQLANLWQAAWRRPAEFLLVSPRAGSRSAPDA